eukprot:762000-Hanusia_phi.AAC.5
MQGSAFEIQRDPEDCRGTGGGDAGIHQVSAKGGGRGDRFGSGGHPESLDRSLSATKKHYLAFIPPFICSVQQGYMMYSGSFTSIFYPLWRNGVENKLFHFLRYDRFSKALLFSFSLQCARGTVKNTGNVTTTTIP